MFKKLKSINAFDNDDTSMKNLRDSNTKEIGNNLNTILFAFTFSYIYSFFIPKKKSFFLRIC